jgi:hypothetical protein
MKAEFITVKNSTEISMKFSSFQKISFRVSKLMDYPARKTFLKKILLTLPTTYNYESDVSSLLTIKP